MSTLLLLQLSMILACLLCLAFPFQKLCTVSTELSSADEAQSSVISMALDPIGKTIALLYASKRATFFHLTGQGKDFAVAQG